MRPRIKLVALMLPALAESALVTFSGEVTRVYQRDSYNGPITYGPGSLVELVLHGTPKTWHGHNVSSWRLRFPEAEVDGSPLSVFYQERPHSHVVAESRIRGFALGSATLDNVTEVVVPFAIAHDIPDEIGEVHITARVWQDASCHTVHDLLSETVEALPLEGAANLTVRVVGQESCNENLGGYCSFARATVDDRCRANDRDEENFEKVNDEMVEMASRPHDHVPLAPILVPVAIILLGICAALGYLWHKERRVIVLSTRQRPRIDVQMGSSDDPAHANSI